MERQPESRSQDSRQVESTCWTLWDSDRHAARVAFFLRPRKRQIGIAPESIERFKAKVRELWRTCQSKTSNELRKAWQSFIRGWWEYFQLAEDRQSIDRLEGWIRRHIRKYFW
jgi:hypothetical protein